MEYFSFNDGMVDVDICVSSHLKKLPWAVDKWLQVISTITVIVLRS